MGFLITPSAPFGMTYYCGGERVNERGVLKNSYRENCTAKRPAQLPHTLKATCHPERSEGSYAIVYQLLNISCHQQANRGIP